METTGLDGRSTAESRLYDAASWGRIDEMRDLFALQHAYPQELLGNALTRAAEQGLAVLFFSFCFVF